MSELLEFWGEWWPDMLGGFVVSQEVTGARLVLGIPFGLLLALGVRSGSAPLRWLCLLVVEVGRGTPALILLQFAYFGFPSVGITFSSFVAATLALAWCTGAYTSEIIRAGLEAVPALLGFSIIMLQANSLCFTIALPEVVSQAYIMGSNTFRHLPIFVLTALMFASVCIPATILVSRLERRLARHVA